MSCKSVISTIIISTFLSHGISVAQDIGFERTDSLTQSVVTAIRQTNSTQVGLQRIDASKLNSGFAFFSTPDVIKTLQSLPGVSAGSELMSGLFVHGGDGSDNLYRLNGVPIYQVSHLAGLFSSFNTDIIEGVDFYKAGFPARYGGRLSSVADIYTRDGNFDKFHGVFSIGLIDGRLQFEGPIIKGKLSYNISARTTWVGPLVSAFMSATSDDKKKSHAWYSFHDINGRISWKVTENSALRFNVYNGLDAFKYDVTKARKDESDPNSEAKIPDTPDDKYDIAWGNTLLSLDYEARLRDNIHSDFKVYLTHNHSRLGMDQNIYQMMPTDTLLVSEHDTSRVTDFGMAADFRWTPVNDKHIIRFGGEFIFNSFYPRTNSLREDGNKVIASTRMSGQETAVYIEDEFSILPWIKANAGIRGALFSFSNATRFYAEPRVAARFIATNNLTFKVSYSEMSQFLHQIATTYIDLPANFWMPSTATIKPMNSRQFAVGAYINLPNQIHINFEGWYKTMNNLLEYVSSFSLFPPVTTWEESYISGKGRSWGSEIEFGWSNGKTDVLVDYTLSWTQRFFPQIWDSWYRDRNDNRHKITISATHKFSKKFDVYAAWNFHCGNRATLASDFVWETATEPDSFFSEPYNFRYPDYHRLDAGMNWRKTTRRGYQSIWNLSIYNVYSRMNAFQIVAKPDDNGKYHGIARGVIPIIPSFSWTLKF